MQSPVSLTPVDSPIPINSVNNSINLYTSNEFIDELVVLKDMSVNLYKKISEEDSIIKANLDQKNLESITDINQLPAQVLSVLKEFSDYVEKYQKLVTQGEKFGFITSEFSKMTQEYTEKKYKENTYHPIFQPSFTLADKKDEKVMEEAMLIAKRIRKNHDDRASSYGAVAFVFSIIIVPSIIAGIVYLIDKIITSIKINNLENKILSEKKRNHDKLRDKYGFNKDNQKIKSGPEDVKKDIATQALYMHGKKQHTFFKPLNDLHKKFKEKRNDSESPGNVTPINAIAGKTLNR